LHSARKCTSSSRWRWSICCILYWVKQQSPIQKSSKTGWEWPTV
jgi:hypothetical protein